MRGNRGGRRGRGRGRGGRGRGRGKKSTKVIESDEDEMPMQSGEEANDENDENQQPSNKSGDWREQPPQLDMEADISLLEAPTFTTINRGPPEPMLRLRWDHPVNLMGEKVLNPMIHCCDKCSKPILIYGRMIPCKHVFCFACAKQEDKTCPRCQDNVSRVEQAGLGSVFMCVHGGTRYGSAGCRRTYLSQRDLQAHINHRHAVASADSTPTQFPVNKEMPAQSQMSKIAVQTPSSHPPPISSHSHQSHHSSHLSSSQQRIKHVSNTTDPRIQSVDVGHHRSSRGPSPPPPPPPPYAPMQHRPPMMVAPGYTTTAPPLRTNLITVPIQDVNASISSLEMPTGSYHHHYTQPPPSQYTHSPYGVPPPAQGQYYPGVTYSSAQPQYVPQVVPQGVPPVAGMAQASQQVQGVPQVPQTMGQTVAQVPQGVPPPQGMSTSLRPPQYQDNQYRAPPPSHPPQWQHPTNSMPPFYR